MPSSELRNRCSATELRWHVIAGLCRHVGGLLFTPHLASLLSSGGEPRSAPLHLLFARFLLVCGNEFAAIGNLQYSRASVVSAAKRADIPLAVGTVGFLDMSAHQVFLHAYSDRTIDDRLAAELLPMFQP